MELHDTIETHIPRLSAQRKKALEKLGIATLYDFLYHFPTRYERFDSAPSDTPTGNITLTGIITSLKMRRIFRKRTMIAEGSIKTPSGTFSLKWFNQPYIAKQYSVGDVITISGKLTGTKTPYIANPHITTTSVVDTTTSSTGTLIPIYSESLGITSRFIISVFNKILPLLRDMDDPIPSYIRESYNLPSRYDSLLYIHKPQRVKDIEIARKRFAFEEIFLLHTQRLREREENKEKDALYIAVDKKLTQEFIQRFPFTLTGDQLSSVNDIVLDLRRGFPMQRLLQGDVGSGKTAVAAICMHNIVSTFPRRQKYGRCQVAYMAPTEILAVQQFNTLIEAFEHMPVSIALMTSSQCQLFPSKLAYKKTSAPSKASLKKQVANGEVAIVVGTHALIQKDVVFKNLACVIVDEQHRFGIAQREKLVRSDNVIPHLLSMTATPIPRTLALTIYADLDISTILELPKDRVYPDTTLITKKDTTAMWEELERAVENNRQAYVVCPRIKEDEDSALHSVEQVADMIKKKYPDTSISVIHGGMKSKEKTRVMETFKNGDISILVATTVIEVGINIPNAVVMIIYNAERFGLAQLHQLRGRISRGAHKGHCFVYTLSSNDDVLSRLNTFVTNKNGFDLAQKDLELRGCGELLGDNQSGFADFAMEALQNKKLVEYAQKSAQKVVDSSLHTTLPKEIQKELSIRRGHSHFE